MKTIENITIYQCSYCNKYYKRKHFCERHEKMCGKNPINQYDCWICSNLKKWREPSMNEFKGKLHFVCNETKKELYTNTAIVRKYSVIKENNSELMPVNCKYFKLF